MGSQAEADRVRSSYAALGLRPGAPLAEARRRYLYLAQRWHPDRHAGDPRNQAEANAVMRRINDAYQAIVGRRATTATRGPQSPQVNARLSPEEIVRLAAAIGSDGPVDWALDSLSWVGGAFEALLLGACVVGCALQFASALWHRDLSVFRGHPEVVLVVPLILLLVVRERLRRRTLVHLATRGAE